MIFTDLIRKNAKIRQIISGKPVVVISPNGLVYESFKSLNITIDDITEMLRQNGYYSFDQILYAIIETNGKISIIPQSDNAPATAKDLGVKNPPAEIPSIVISDGKMMKEAMIELNLDIDSLKKILDNLNISSVKDVIVLSIDKNGRTYYQTKNNKATTIENIFKEIQLWNFGFQC